MVQTDILLFITQKFILYQKILALKTASNRYCGKIPSTADNAIMAKISPQNSSARTAKGKQGDKVSFKLSIYKRLTWVFLSATLLFVIASMLSYDPADPPTHNVVPANNTITNWCGPVGAYLSHYAYSILGAGVWLGLGLLFYFLIETARSKKVSHPVIRFIGCILMVLSASALQFIYFSTVGPFAEGGGGIIAIAGANLLLARFSTLGSTLIIMLIFSVGAIVAVDTIILAIPSACISILKWIYKLPVWSYIKNITRLIYSMLHPKSALANAHAANNIPINIHGQGTATVAGKRSRSKSADDNEKIDPDAGGLGAVKAFDPDQETLADGQNISSNNNGTANNKTSADKLIDMQALREKVKLLPINFASKQVQPVSNESDLPRTEDYSGYVFPGLDLLNEPETTYSQQLEDHVREQAFSLEHALQTYRIDGKVVEIDSGPVITLYEIQLKPGTKVAAITSVQSDIARALRAPNIRIVPNMAGKTTVGIEVPNLNKERVSIKELMTSAKNASDMNLPMFLAKDASGTPLVADLTRMPHMLIAGTTGSGKSVCMNTIIMSFLYTKRPDELKLILVDPKMVEMSQFKHIPHLMCPVVTETTKAAAILDWAVTKMEERYELLAEVGVRDIAKYNALSWEEIEERIGPFTEEEALKIPKKLPYIVFVVDELADLIMTCKEVETSIVRIAQKARAVGIHLILATQRPQANVVTGLIKSNMPCRISFKVSSGMDSRIVLDQKGAEILLGQGDMLYLSPHSSDLIRAQGTLVGDQEIRKVVRFLKTVAAPSFERQLMTIRSIDTDTDDNEGLNERDRDPMFFDAVDIIVETGRGSVSLLQRRLAIGYTRASRLIDQMGLAGIIGEHKGTVAREVVVTKEEWQHMRQMMEQSEAEGTLFGDSTSGENVVQDKNTTSATIEDKTVSTDILNKQDDESDIEYVDENYVEDEEEDQDANDIAIDDLDDFPLADEIEEEVDYFDEDFEEFDDVNVDDDDDEAVEEVGGVGGADEDDREHY